MPSTIGWTVLIDGLEKQYHLDPDCRYLTFNYTDTLETEYGIPASHIAHVHGSRLMNDEYVVGHNNKRSPSDPWGEDGIFFEQQALENIIRWMDEMTKDYAGNIARHRLFFNSLSNIKQIITYGHSMALVDLAIFRGDY